MKLFNREEILILCRITLSMFLVLKELKEGGPAWGYRIYKNIANNDQATMGTGFTFFSCSMGSTYRACAQLVAANLIEADTGDADERQGVEIYTINKRGREVLAEILAALRFDPTKSGAPIEVFQ